MSKSLRFGTWFAGLLLVAGSGLASLVWAEGDQPTPLAAQPAPAVAPAAPAVAPAASAAVQPQTTVPYRQLAPGVMISIDPGRQEDETFSRHDVVELTAVDPDFNFAKQIPFRRDIWYLEFKFKPIRMIYVDLPQPSGKMERKLIWYMLYSVTNPGKAMHPVQQADTSYTMEYVDKPVRFVPEFLLECSEFPDRKPFPLAYPDRVIPLAVGPIRMREDPNRPIYNSVEMTREIAVGETVWGVATWEDIDPQMDRFSVYVAGLTNAYRWADEPGAYKTGDKLGKGRRLARKTLKLNFWRPGDEYYMHEEEIRFGIPGQVDYEWVYR